MFQVPALGSVTHRGHCCSRTDDSSVPILRSKRRTGRSEVRSEVRSSPPDNRFLNASRSCRERSWRVLQMCSRTSAARSGRPDASRLTRLVLQPEWSRAALGFMRLCLCCFTFCREESSVPPRAAAGLFMCPEWSRKPSQTRDHRESSSTSPDRIWKSESVNDPVSRDL